jgi:hypothetical protein
MEFGDRHEMVIPIGVDPKLVVESVRYLGEQIGKAKDFLITSENGIVSILRTK